MQGRPQQKHKVLTSPIYSYPYCNLTKKLTRQDALPQTASTNLLPEGSNSKKGKYTGCNCAKSYCLKMYCVCFVAGRMCDQTCLCQNCKNCSDNMERSQAISEIIDKDPLAFSRKTTAKEVAETVCNCRKSACLKKYCECYRNGKQCGESCMCQGCKNKENEEILQGSKPQKLVKLQ